MKTTLSPADTAAIQANNWRAKEIRKVLRGEVAGKPQQYVYDLLEDILEANYEILDQSIPTHVDKSVPPAPDATSPPAHMQAETPLNGHTVALFVGHNANTGANSYRGEDEWTTRREVAIRAQQRLAAKGYLVGVFYRDPALGYTSAMKAHGKTSKEFGADVSLELHFNCFNGQAKGAEILVYSQATADTLGEAFVASTEKYYPKRVLRDGGVKIRTEGRGAGFNKYQPCPSGIYEPGFADNPIDWDSYWGPGNVEREADYVTDIIDRFFA